MASGGPGLDGPDECSTPSNPQGPADPRSTRTAVPPLADERREVLVALARGYLRPYASGVISPPDGQWLQSRLIVSPAHDEVTRVAQRVATAAAPALLARLQERYGQEWLPAVNANRPPQHRRRDQNLRDFRFCLAVLAHDPATQGWAGEPCRRAARELNRLANDAAHQKTVTASDAARAVELARIIGDGLPNG